MNDTLISVKNLSRRFGNIQAVANLDLNVPQGSIFGLLGTNGAGKTTLIRMLMGHLYPDSGTIEVLGQNPRNHDAKTLQKVAYVSDRMELPWRMCLKEVIELNRQFFPRWNSELAKQLTAEFDINLTARFSHLSLGQKRRAILLQAVCQNADLLILDEPLSGLDAVFRRQSLDMLLAAAADHNQTVFISSHLLHDVERIVDRIAMMRQGTVFHSSDLESLKDRMRRVRVSAEIDSKQRDAFSDMRILGQHTVGGETNLIVDRYTDDMRPALTEAFGDNVRIEHMNLEDIFVELSMVEGTVPADQSTKTTIGASA